MKIVTIIFRTILGLFLINAGLDFFIHHMPPPPPMTGDVKIFMEGVMASKYLLPLVKVLEILCGLTFVIGKFDRLGAIVLLPISINILLVQIFLMPSFVGIGAFILLGNVFMIYKKWGAYDQILKA